LYEEVRQMEPTAVHARLLELISASRWSEIADLYAEDCVVDLPLALPEPDHVRGREQIRERFTRAGAGGLDLRVSDLVLHSTTDPEVSVAEWVYLGRTPGGEPFRAANVQVLRVRDGRIVASRDYHDHARLAAANPRSREPA
jgi:ketosteroid isomerase-like protein